MIEDREYKIDGLFRGNGLCKSPSVWVESGNRLGPLFYLRRPKWIEKDSDWELIVERVFDGFSLPGDFVLNKQEDN